MNVPAVVIMLLNCPTTQMYNKPPQILACIDTVKSPMYRNIWLNMNLNCCVQERDIKKYDEGQSWLRLNNQLIRREGK